MMALVKPPYFFDMDFIMPEWSEQNSPDHSVFSNPGQYYPQMINDEDVQLLLPASSFDIDAITKTFNKPASAVNTQAGSEE